MFARFLPSETFLDIVTWLRFSFLLSIFLMFVSVELVWQRGLSYGIDFSGGYAVQAELPHGISEAQVKHLLEEAGVEHAHITVWGQESQHVQLRFAADEKDAGQGLQASASTLEGLLKKHDAGAQLVKSEYVSPELSRDFYRKGMMALALTLCVILFYIALRFSFRFAAATVAGLVFDVVVIAGLFALLQVEITLAVLAALLTVVGYSLNDTLVMLARVRHNMVKFKDADFQDVVNLSVNETLIRTLMMSFITLCAFGALYVWGGDTINGFAFTLISGVIVGTYSSLAFALPLVLFSKRYYGKKTR